MTAKRARPFPILLGGGLVVGSFDIAYAIVFWAFRGVAPVRVLQSVAAGVLGRASFSGGVTSALLGLALHYFIAIAIVAIYWLMARGLSFLSRHAVLCGAIYGIVVYLVMNLVVLPLSRAAKPNLSNLLWVACSVIVHVFLIGVPAALFARAALPDAPGRSGN